MVYKRFSVGVIIRVGLLLATMLCLAFIFANTALFFNQVLLLLLLIFQVYELIRFVNQTNRDLSKFLLAIKHTDFAVNFLKQEQLGKSFHNLHHSFHEIIRSYKEAEARNASQDLFFKLIIEHIQAGIISLSDKKEIVLINKAAQDLLKISPVLSWSQVEAAQSDFASAVAVLAGGGRTLVEIKDAGTIRQLSIIAEPVILLGKAYQIITFQDIKNEIEQKEIEAWHKLIRILTHEIMNSVTPVVSLTETMLMILEEEKGVQKELAAITDENIADIRYSLNTIQKRSDGMLHFIHDYRKLTRIPMPQLEKIAVKNLLENVSKLMQGEINKNQVRLQLKVTDQTIMLLADVSLIEQVLINLITNSLQALEGVRQPSLILSAYADATHTYIAVSDNGRGIDQDKLERIFIPFYSTKKAGSGIGLSVSRQIMRLHHGSIKVLSDKGIQTTFLLQFPKR